MQASMDSEDWMKGTGSLGYLKVWGENLTTVNVDCYPLSNILASANMRRLDLLSLDVQGAELDILRTIPWDVVDIQVMLRITRITKNGVSI